MLKKYCKTWLVFLLAMFIGNGLYAEKGNSRLLIGMGLMFDANGLGGTIMKDGLDSGYAKYDSEGNYAGQQQIFIPENQLQALENISGGVFNVKRNGSMTAGQLALGFEYDLTDSLFFRAGFNWTTKISGGNTKANFMGFTWYDVTWNYHNTTVPIFIGPKFDIKDDEQNIIGSVYAGFGLHWYRAWWSVKGSNNGEALHAATNGLTQDLPVTSNSHNPGLVYDDARFAASGVGFNWVVGVQGALNKSSKPLFLFAEVETLMSGDIASGSTKTPAGWGALSPYPAYPVLAAGNYYRFGIKLSL